MDEERMALLKVVILVVGLPVGCICQGATTALLVNTIGGVEGFLLALILALPVTIAGAGLAAWLVWRKLAS